MSTLSVQEIAALMQGKVQGDPNLTIAGITSIAVPLPGHMAYVNSADQISELEKTALVCLLAPPGSTSEKTTLIIVEQPKICWAKLLSVFHPARAYPAGISEQAHVSPKATIAEGCTIEPFAYIGDNVTVGKGSVIRAHAYIDNQVTIGENTVIHPQVMIYDHTIIGSNVIIHGGTVVGSDGFGYVFADGQQYKVPQIGNVVIEDNVEIGSNTSIDRATMGSTIIQKDAKIDNLVQIAHNVTIGRSTVASSQVGISGSTRVGNNVILAGQVGVADHCDIGDGAIIGAQAGLATKKKIPPKQIYFGSPARPYQESRKILASQAFLHDTVKKVRALEREVAALKLQLESKV